MNSIYNTGDYLNNNPSWHSEDSPWKAEQIFKIIQKNFLNPAHICEIGCGSGEILINLNEKIHDANFTGYEISPQAFAICSRKSSSNVNFVSGNLLEDSRAHFDCLLCIDVFEHVEYFYTAGALSLQNHSLKTKIVNLPRKLIYSLNPDMAVRLLGGYSLMVLAKPD